MIHIQNLVHYLKFRHVQAYSRPSQPYSAILWHIQNSVELLHIQNHATLRILAYLGPKICRTLSRHILAYSEHIENAAIIQDFAIFRVLAYLGPKAYLESCLYRHIQAYSIIVTTTLTFFFHFDLIDFSTKFKKANVF